MKTFKTNFLFVTTLFVCTSLGFAAQGDKTGNGGDENCANYVQMVNRVSVALVNIGQKKVDLVNKVIAVEELRKAAKKMKCIPVETQDRPARTRLETEGMPVTTLLWERWKNMSEMEKVDLASHELAVSRELEGEGDYSVSVDIVSLVKSSKQFAVFKCGKVTHINGATLCSSPTMIGMEGKTDDKAERLISYKSSVKGLCRYLGFQSAEASTVESLPVNNMKYVELNSSGYPVALNTCEPGGYYAYLCNVITSVTCE